MKLEAGMYCYNKTNRKLGIGKIIDFQRNNNVNIRYKNDFGFSSAGNVIASFNIIDILEKGDIINYSGEKHEILLIDDELMVRNTGLIYDNNYYLPIKSITIKSVITHEQIEQMAYKVGE